jgi:hypothetical protein
LARTSRHASTHPARITSRGMPGDARQGCAGSMRLVQPGRMQGGWSRLVAIDARSTSEAAKTKPPCVAQARRGTEL